MTLNITIRYRLNDASAADDLRDIVSNCVVSLCIKATIAATSILNWCVRIGLNIVGTVAIYLCPLFISKRSLDRVRFDI